MSTKSSPFPPPFLSPLQLLLCFSPLSHRFMASSRLALLQTYTHSLLRALGGSLPTSVHEFRAEHLGLENLNLFSLSAATGCSSRSRALCHPLSMLECHLVLFSCRSCLGSRPLRFHGCAASLSERHCLETSILVL